MSYKEFRIEALYDDTVFKVQVRGFLSWKSGYVYTNYFAISYPTKDAAIKAIDGYKNRFTDVPNG